MSHKHKENLPKKVELEVLWQGLLTKQGGGRKNWRRRFFTLHRDGKLFYYKEKAYRGEKAPQGYIQLTSAAVVQEELHKKSNWMFSVLGDWADDDCRRFWMFADNERDRKRWISELSQCINSLRPSTSDSPSSESYLKLPSPGEGLHKEEVDQTDVVSTEASEAVIAISEKKQMEIDRERELKEKQKLIRQSTQRLREEELGVLGAKETISEGDMSADELLETLRREAIEKDLEDQSRVRRKEEEQERLREEEKLKKKEKEEKERERLRRLREQRVKKEMEWKEKREKDEKERREKEKEEREERNRREKEEQERLKKERKEKEEQERLKREKERLEREKKEEEG